jgi:hypothetical protein
VAFFHAGDDEVAVRRSAPEPAPRRKATGSNLRMAAVAGAPVPRTGTGNFRPY